MLFGMPGRQLHTIDCLLSMSLNDHPLKENTERENLCPLNIRCFVHK